MLIVKMVLTSSHGQADVERGFSLNNKLLAEYMQGQILIVQRLVKVHILCNGYLSHNVPITRELITLFPIFKTALKEKKKNCWRKLRKMRHRLLEDYLKKKAIWIAQYPLKKECLKKEKHGLTLSFGIFIYVTFWAEYIFALSIKELNLFFCYSYWTGNHCVCSLLNLNFCA